MSEVGVRRPLLARLLGDDIELLKDVRIACIGPVTAKTAEELLGRVPDLVADDHTIPGLVQALQSSLERNAD